MSGASPYLGGPMFTTSGTPTLPSSSTVMGERSWREQEIYLNKPLMAARPSLLRVCLLNVLLF